MAKQRDYYEILGVDRSATTDQIRTAYRKLARKLHPDVNKASDAAKKFAEVQEAYDALSDKEKRASYDQFGHAGVGVGAGPNPRGGRWNAAAGGPGGRTRTTWSNIDPGDFDAGDFGSVFEQMFGGGASSFGAGRQGAGPRGRSQAQKGQDVEHTITVTFLTAALGGSEQLRFGSDGSAGTISVKIPSGIESGAKLRLKGRGTPSPSGGPSGDLIITVEVGQHPYFRRDGLDLLIDVPFTIVEAVTGTTVTLPLLTSASGAKSSVRLKVPPGTASGRKLRIKGKGITDAAGTSGDLYAVVQIVAPAEADLSEKAQAALKSIQPELKNPRDSSPWVDTE